MYDYFLGGYHNFEVDRKAAERAIAIWPDFPLTLRANRAFLRRAVRYLVARGIGQFLDIGSGIPTAGNVHEIALQASADSRIVYVDNEAVAVAHSELMLADVPQAAVIDADLRSPGEVLNHAKVREMIDFDRPVLLLMLAVLHFVPEPADLGPLIERYRNKLAPGSLLAITHATGDHRPKEQEEGLVNLYATSTNAAFNRSRQQITALFGDFELIEPGAVYVPEWRPDEGEAEEHPERFLFFGGVAEKKP
jgi:trans-aconitate methyltransferase